MEQRVDQFVFFWFPGTKTHRNDENIVNLYFNTTDIPKQEDIVTAELQLFPNNSASSSSLHRYKIDIYEILSRPHSVEGAITRLDRKSVV